MPLVDALSSAWGDAVTSAGGRHLMSSTTDQNWFLIVIIVVVTAAIIVGNLYLLVYYSHPDDKNQAWVPKIVVLLGLTLAFCSVLMLPLDRANRAACREGIVLSACEFTLPMKTMWYWVYMAMVIIIAFVIPFTMFFYESDSDKSLLGRLWEAGQWWFVCIICLALILGVSYSLAGKVDYSMQTLNSGLTIISNDLMDADGCIVPGFWNIAGEGKIPNATSTKPDYSCDAGVGTAAVEKWSTQCTFPVYVIALATIVGWLLFMVFAGVGFIALPVDLLKAYKNRPRQTITKTEYVRQASEMGKRAKVILDGLKAQQLEERRHGRTRKTRRRIKEHEQELLALEEEEYRLREVYPQSEEREVAWAMTVLGYFLSFIGGIASVALTGCWLIHLVIYEFVQPPLSPMLNQMFMDLDSVFGLFGTAMFAIFCFYLVACTVKGNFKLGVNFLLFTVHPMSPGNTLMSSFLFNTAVIMLCSISIIQFCSQVFDQYANETAVDEIFGNQVMNLRGIGALFRYGAFLYALFIIAGLTALISPFLSQQTWKPKKNYDPDD